MAQRQIAMCINDRRCDAINLDKVAALYAQELGAWRKYDALVAELNDVYAEIRAWNMVTYTRSAQMSLAEAIARQNKPVEPTEARRNEMVLAILHRGGQAKAAGIVRELRCARTSVYKSLHYLQAWGYIRCTTRGVFELIQDESA